MTAAIMPGGLGRKYAEDTHDHVLRAAVAETRDPRTKLWPFFAHWLDQGQTGTCVGHGWRHYLTCTPKPLRDPVPSPFTIYDDAIQIDEWTDNDHDTARQMGTSVRAGAKVVQRRGLIEGYGWCPTVDTAARYLSWTGPLVAGVPWYGSMDRRDSGRFLTIAPDAQIVGGHCFLVQGWDQKRGAAVCLNSWADFGRFYLSGETLARLLREEGELCSAQELAHRRG